MSVKIKENSIKWKKPIHKSKWKGLAETWPKGTEYRLWKPDQDTNPSSSIKWHSGIDVHLKQLTVALFGIDQKHDFTKVLGPIITVGTTIEGYQEMFEMYEFFTPVRILMETTGIYSLDPYHQCVARYPAKDGKNQVSEKQRYMMVSVSVGMALGVIIAMLAGADGIYLPIGIGTGIAVGAVVGAMLIRRGQGG